MRGDKPSKIRADVFEVLKREGYVRGFTQMPAGQTTDGTHIRFVATGILPGQKTERWQVVAKADGGRLGEIKWFGHWRKYSFFAAADCVFEETCMRDISRFLEERSRERRRLGRMMARDDV